MPEKKSDKKIVFSNKISKATRGRFDRAIKMNGHVIAYVLEQLFEFYAKYGLPTDKNAAVKNF